METSQIYTNNDLKLDVRVESDEVHFSWLGESTERDPGKFLTPIFNEYFFSDKNQFKKITMDFRQLNYMNSSTVTPIIRLIDKIKNGNNKLLIVYQKDSSWQELSFSALFIFTTRDKRIEIQGL